MSSFDVRQRQAQSLNFEKSTGYKNLEQEKKSSSRILDNSIVRKENCVEKGRGHGAQNQFPKQASKLNQNSKNFKEQNLRNLSGPAQKPHTFISEKSPSPQFGQFGGYSWFQKEKVAVNFGCENAHENARENLLNSKHQLNEQAKKELVSHIPSQWSLLIGQNHMVKKHNACFIQRKPVCSYQACPVANTFIPRLSVCRTFCKLRVFAWRVSCKWPKSNVEAWNAPYGEPYKDMEPAHLVALARAHYNSQYRLPKDRLLLERELQLISANAEKRRLNVTGFRALKGPQTISTDFGNPQSFSISRNPDIRDEMVELKLGNTRIRATNREMSNKVGITRINPLIDYSNTSLEWSQKKRDSDQFPEPKSIDRAPEQRIGPPESQGKILKNPIRSSVQGAVKVATQGSIRGSFRGSIRGSFRGLDRARTDGNDDFKAIEFEDPRRKSIIDGSENHVSKVKPTESRDESRDIGADFRDIGADFRDNSRANSKIIEAVENRKGFGFFQVSSQNVPNPAPILFNSKSNEQGFVQPPVWNAFKETPIWDDLILDAPVWDDSDFVETYKLRESILGHETSIWGQETSILGHEKLVLGHETSILGPEMSVFEPETSGLPVLAQTIAPKNQTHSFQPKESLKTGPKGSSKESFSIISGRSQPGIASRKAALFDQAIRENSVVSGQIPDSIRSALKKKSDFLFEKFQSDCFNEQKDRN